jgi:hypothetical protein
LIYCLLRFLLVLRVGIEPTLQEELDFESSASTSFATEAKGLKINKFHDIK